MHFLPECHASQSDNHGSAEPYETCGQFVNPGIKVTPRVGLMYSLNQDNVIKWLFGKGVRQPSFGQNSDVIASGRRLDHERIDAHEGDLSQPIHQ